MPLVNNFSQFPGSMCARVLLYQVFTIRFLSRASFLSSLIEERYVYICTENALGIFESSYPSLSFSAFQLRKCHYRNKSDLSDSTLFQIDAARLPGQTTGIVPAQSFFAYRIKRVSTSIPRGCCFFSVHWKINQV